MVENYRTIEPRTPRVLKMWIKDERLAFDRKPSSTVKELLEVLPTEQVGDIRPDDKTFEIFRKISYNFSNVSEVWIRLMRFIGIPDFSIEQAILGSVAVMLDHEGVRVGLHQVGDGSNRKNSIEVFCLNEPDYQGFIRYEADRVHLSLPPSIFSAFVKRHLSLYEKHYSDYTLFLTIPAEEVEEVEEDVRESKSNLFDILGVGKKTEDYSLEDGEATEVEEVEKDVEDDEDVEGDGLEF